MPPLRKLRPLVLLSLVALTGCGTAHVVSKDLYGGVVAIPENSDSWPNHYRARALELIKKECPDYVIVKEEVVTGTVTTNRDSTETRNQDLTPKNSRYGATATTTDTAHTTEVRNRTEYRIYYRKKDPPYSAAMPPVTRAPVTTVPPVQQVSTLPPEPTPISAPSTLPAAPIPVAPR
jgi:hypothetical protein